jgi:hypothetical protein
MAETAGRRAIVVSKPRVCEARRLQTQNVLGVCRSSTKLRGGIGCRAAKQTTKGNYIEI